MTKSIDISDKQRHATRLLQSAALAALIVGIAAVPVTFAHHGGIELAKAFADGGDSDSNDNGDSDSNDNSSSDDGNEVGDDSSSDDGNEVGDDSSSDDGNEVGDDNEIDANDETDADTTGDDDGTPDQGAGDAPGSVIPPTNP